MKQIQSSLLAPGKQLPTTKLRAWIQRYNHHSPHQSLKYLSPNHYHQERCNQAA